MILAGILVAGCQPPSQSTVTGWSATSTPFRPGGAIPQTGLVLDRPERIVQAFLTDVQEAPDQLSGYMSKTLQQEYPRDAIVAVLALPGNIEGFAIQAATVSPSMALGNVFVSVTSGGSVIQYRFTLILENGNWVISSIEKH